MQGFSGGCGNVHVGACDGSVRGYFRGSQTENGHGPGIYLPMGAVSGFCGRRNVAVGCSLSSK